jgi:acyl carrier protein
MPDLASDKLMDRDLNRDVRNFILKKFPLARKQQIKDPDMLMESGILDSQGVLEVVAFIEQEFSIPVMDEDLVPENFQTIDRIAGFIADKTKSRRSGSA